MPCYCSPEDHADHRRDLDKHEPRPTDPINALEVAVLVKSVPLTVGADLIERYAACVAEGAKLDGVSHACDRVDAALSGVRR